MAGAAGLLRALNITESLEDALRAVRAAGTGLLWIDAICVDQSNLQE